MTLTTVLVDQLRNELHDTGDEPERRYSDTKLVGYLNQAIKDILSRAPEANVVVEDFDLDASSPLQTLPAGATKFHKVVGAYYLGAGAPTQPNKDAWFHSGWTVGAGGGGDGKAAPSMVAADDEPQPGDEGYYGNIALLRSTLSFFPATWNPTPANLSLSGATTNSVVYDHVNDNFLMFFYGNNVSGTTEFDFYVVETSEGTVAGGFYHNQINWPGEITFYDHLGNSATNFMSLYGGVSYNSVYPWVHAYMRADGLIVGEPMRISGGTSPAGAHQFTMSVNDRQRMDIVASTGIADNITVPVQWFYASPNRANFICQLNNSGFRGELYTSTNGIDWTLVYTKVDGGTFSLRYGASGINDAGEVVSAYHENNVTYIVPSANGYTPINVTTYFPGVTSGGEAWDEWYFGSQPGLADLSRFVYDEFNARWIWFAPDNTSLNRLRIISTSDPTDWDPNGANCEDHGLIPDLALNVDYRSVSANSVAYNPNKPGEVLAQIQYRNPLGGASGNVGGVYRFQYGGVGYEEVASFGGPAGYIYGLPTMAVNYVPGAANLERGPQLRYAEKDVFDTYDDDWYYDTSYPSGADYYQHFMHDPRDPTRFYVWRAPKDGDRVVVAYSKLPDEIGDVTDVFPIREQWEGAAVMFAKWLALIEQGRKSYLPEVSRSRLLNEYTTVVEAARQAIYSDVLRDDG